MSVRKRIALLLCCGFVAAIVGGWYIDAGAPKTWEIQSGRASDLNRSLDVVNRGGPPLVAQIGDARPLPKTKAGRRHRFEAVGIADDQGIYVYVPVLAHVLGVHDPLAVLKGMYVGLFAISLLLYPLLFYGLFGSWAAALVAPLGLLVSIRLLGYHDIYWVPAWTVLTLIPVVLLLATRWPRYGMVLLVAVMVTASFASSIRSASGLPILIAAAMVLLLRPWRWWWKGVAVAGLVLASLTISNFALTAVRHERDAWAGAELGANRVTSHVFWHSAYIGLGFGPNKYGIKYNDSIADAAAKKESPGVAYVSPKYEATLRKLYFRILREDPWFVIRTTLKKGAVILDRAAFVLPVLLIGAAIALLLAPDRRRLSLYLILLAPALTILFLPPLIVQPIITYELGWLGALALMGVLMLSRVAASVTSAPRLTQLAQVRRWRPVASLRALLRTRLGMVTVVCVCLGFVAVGASVLYGPRLQRQYDCWQALPQAAGTTGCSLSQV